MRRKKIDKHKNKPSTRRCVRRVVGSSVADEPRVSTKIEPEDLQALKVKISELKEEIQKLHNAGGSLQKVEVVPSAVVQVLGHIATNAWRAKVKMVDPDTGEAKEEMKRVYRHIEGIFDALSQIGIETIDPTGRAYDSGLTLKVVSFEQTPGLSKEEIKETIKPSVKWQGQLIQMGEVIVGTPQTA